MKITILSLSLLFTLNSFAQEAIDPDEINQQIEQSKLQRKEERKKKRKEKLHQMAVSFAAPYKALPSKVIIPPKDQLTELQEKQVEVLRCVRTIIQKHKGGIESANIAAEIVNLAMEDDVISENQSQLQKASDTCQSFVEKVARLKVKTTEVESRIYKLEEAGTITPKVSALLFGFLDPRGECRGYEVSATAGVFFGGKAGVHKLKCYNSDARIINLAGVGIGLGLGFGVGIHVENMDDMTLMTKQPNQKTGVAVSTGEAEFMMGLGIGAVSDDVDTSAGPALGAGITCTAGTVRLSARLWNGPERWQPILVKLGKY